MSVESDPTPDPEPTIPALSFFFPEVTEDEARYLDGETALIMERRARIMTMYRRGRYMKDIASELKCSVGTVHRDIHLVLEGYKRIAARNANEHLADALQRLADREADIEREWEKSKGEQVETFTGRRSAGKDKGSDEAKVKKKQRYGDPRLATLLLGIWDRRCKLLGLLRPEDPRDTDGSAVPDVTEIVIEHHVAVAASPAAVGGD